MEANIIEGNMPEKTSEEKQKEIKRNKRKKMYKGLIKLLIKTCCILLAGYLILSYALMFYRVSGNNMFPSLKDGDFCIFDRISPIKSNDVVVYTDNNGELKAGRIVGTPGQEINFIENGGFEINNVIVYDEIPYNTFKAESNNITYPMNINDNEYFILNDFRSDTKDSREVGVINKNQIKGCLLFQFRKRGF